MIKFRPTLEDDRPTIAEWIAADADHRTKAAGADFFLTRGNGTSCYTIMDEWGPIIFVRQDSEKPNCRLHTQFPPKERSRVVNALKAAYPLVAMDAKSRGFKAVVFESCSIALVRFMFQFGFVAELKHDLGG